MGWASGSYLAETIWDEIKDILPDAKKDELAVKIYNAFCEADADDWEWGEGNLFTTACKKEYPQDYAEYKAECEA